MKLEEKEEPPGKNKIPSTLKSIFTVQHLSRVSTELTTELVGGVSSEPRSNLNLDSPRTKRLFKDAKSPEQVLAQVDRMLKYGCLGRRVMVEIETVLRALERTPSGAKALQKWTTEERRRRLSASSVTNWKEVRKHKPGGEDAY